jgi:hypothetical protein
MNEIKDKSELLARSQQKIGFRNIVDWYGLKHLILDTDKLLVGSERSVFQENVNQFGRWGLCNGYPMPEGYTFKVVHEESMLADAMRERLTTLPSSHGYVVSISQYSRKTKDADPYRCAFVLLDGERLKNLLLHLIKQYPRDLPAGFFYVSEGFETGFITDEYAGTPSDGKFDDHRIFEVAYWGVNNGNNGVRHD